MHVVPKSKDTLSCVRVSTLAYVKFMGDFFLMMGKIQTKIFYFKTNENSKVF